MIKKSFKIASQNNSNNYSVIINEANTYFHLKKYKEAIEKYNILLNFIKGILMHFNLILKNFK